MDRAGGQSVELRLAEFQSTVGRQGYDSYRADLTFRSHHWAELINVPNTYDGDYKMSLFTVS